MTGVEILLLIAGITATTLVVVAMILIVPRGGVPVQTEERDLVTADLSANGASDRPEGVRAGA